MSEGELHRDPLALGTLAGAGTPWLIILKSNFSNDNSIINRFEDNRHKEVLLLSIQCKIFNYLNIFKFIAIYVLLYCYFATVIMELTFILYTILINKVNCVNL